MGGYMRRKKLHQIAHERHMGDVMREEIAKKPREEKPIVGYLLKDMAAELMKRKR
jgi:hypothetical protein